MSAYTALARYYDDLTRDVSYERFADYYAQLFQRENISVHSILDAACGTGTLTCLLAERGYDMIGTDMSEDMLSEAHNKAGDLKHKPLFLNQSMETLDLYGTVDAVVCSLDGLNYVRPDVLTEAFGRVLLFLEPGGLFVFDIRTPAFLRSQDGAVSLDETDDVYCVWRARFDQDLNALIYGMDLFALEGRKWARYGEEHIEYAYEPMWLDEQLRQKGFTDVHIYGDTTFEAPTAEMTRLFITARKPRS